MICIFIKCHDKCFSVVYIIIMYNYIYMVPPCNLILIRDLMAVDSSLDIRESVEL